MNNKHIPLSHYHQFTPDEMLTRAKTFTNLMQSRRSVRDFSTNEVPMTVIDECILAAGSAPSGANQQPWHFVTIVDQTVKREIRLAAEEEERAFYAGRAGDTWLDTLEPLGTDANKPFLENAPVLIAIFEQKFATNEQGSKIKHYYSKESTGIAAGLLITALHNAGLATLTHTPSPMNFLSEILNRPSGERPFLLLVVGYPEQNATVPDISKKDLDEIRTQV
jgi:nitroreductase